MGPQPLTEKEMDEAIAEMRIDSKAYELFDEGELDRMERRCRRKHASGQMPANCFDGPINCPELNVYMRQCTELNIIKLARLGIRNPEMYELYGLILEARPMDHGNRCVGAELDELFAVAGDNKVPQAERTRMLQLHQLNDHELRMKPCVQWTRSGSCEFDVECRCWHVDPQ